VHYERRRREFGIRLALGASRAQLARRLVLELTMVIGAGSAAALLSAWWGTALLPRLRLPGGLDLSRVDFSMDWRVAAAALGCCTVATVTAASWPIVRFTRSAPAGSLSTPTATSSRGSIRVRQVVLAGHVAASVAVLIGAGLLVKSVAIGFAQGPGFDDTRTLFVDVQSQPAYRGETEDEKARGWPADWPLASRPSRASVR
jgi:putative ABC transport system permease protein